MKRALLLSVSLLLAGCEVAPREVGSSEFDPSKVAYFKDRRTNVCFAVASYSRMDTSGRQAGGLSHSFVPCSPEIERLIR